MAVLLLDTLPVCALTLKFEGGGGHVWTEGAARARGCDGDGAGRAGTPAGTRLQLLHLVRRSRRIRAGTAPATGPARARVGLLRVDWCPHCRALDQMLETYEVRSRLNELIK